MIAVSWPFHQMMDGIATTEKIPLLRLAFISALDHTLAVHDNRYEVSVGIEFRDAASASYYQPPTGAIQVHALNWRTFAYVKNKESFKSYLEWKHNSSTMVWNKIDQELNSDDFDHCLLPLLLCIQQMEEEARDLYSLSTSQSVVV